MKEKVADILANKIENQEKEITDFTNFFRGMAPLVDKLVENPVIQKRIMCDHKWHKIYPEGTLSTEDMILDGKNMICECVDCGEICKIPGLEPANKSNPDQSIKIEGIVVRQGQELRELKNFFSNIAPILNKLDENPEIVKAIMDGNITLDIAKAAIEGRLLIKQEV